MVRIHQDSFLCFFLLKFLLYSISEKISYGLYALFTFQKVHLNRVFFMNHLFFFLIFLIFSAQFAIASEPPEQLATEQIDTSYPAFDDNPFITEEMRTIMRPYLLPLDHPARAALDAIFKQSRAIESPEAFAAAGFHTLFAQQKSFIRVASHRKLKGFLLKVYLDSEVRQRLNIPGWQWLATRCKSVEKIKRLIKRKNLRYFTTPEKALYPLPVDPAPLLVDGQTRQTVVLLVTDMHLVSHEESLRAWKEIATTRHLDELYCIMSHGHTSTYLAANIPYTKEGKFSCIDTENIGKRFKYEKCRDYFSEEMKLYWDQLIQTNGAISSVK